MTARRFGVDRSVRRMDHGRRIIGGSPLKFFSVTAAGARMLDDVAAGRSVELTPGRSELLGRLVDAGALHPLPSAGESGCSAADVTVVVPVRDRLDGLARLLRSLRDASDRVNAIVVVDDGSVDPAGCAEVAAEVGAEVVRRNVSGGPAIARNDGLAQVTTDLVAFVDSDCTVSSDWLAPLLAQFADPAVVLVAPRVVPSSVGDSGSVLTGYELAHSPLDLGEEPARVAPGTRVAYVPSAAMVARAGELRDAGGFDTSMLVGEDVDLVWRLVETGHRIRYEPRSVVRHDVRADLRSWIEQRYSYGSSAAALEQRHHGDVAPAALSRWSLAVWAAAALGHPAVGAGIAAASIVLLRRKLADVPAGEVVRLGVHGNLGAGRQLAVATVRVWWPAAAVASVLSRRVRRVVGAAALVSVADQVVSDRRVGSASPSSAAIGLLDHLAYGAGVWAGCVRARSFRALLPRVTS